MKIRVISDLHIDVNRNSPFSIVNKDIFTLIPGDVSGDVFLTEKWIKENVHYGMFIAGNHDPAYNQHSLSIESQKKHLADAFRLEDDVTFLDASIDVMSKVVPGTDVLVIGTTLYTDYKYTNDIIKKEADRLNAGRLESKWKISDVNMYYARNGLNDFNLGKVDFDGTTRRVLPADYLEWFNESMKKITEIIESKSNENPDVEIIVMTHHCPTPSLIHPKYMDSTINASYVSDLEDFIVSHRNVKAWVCGHVHHANNIVLSTGQLIVCNPRGYVDYFEDRFWDPNMFIDTDKWTINVE